MTNKYEEIDELTLRLKAPFNDVYQLAMDEIISNGGKIKTDDFHSGYLEGAWRYGLNFGGLRVAIHIRKTAEDDIELHVEGGFKNSIDTFGSGKKKAVELIGKLKNSIDKQFNKFENIPKKEQLLEKQKKIHTKLISCNTCGGTFSALADNCVKCGEPNNWIHPNIEKLIKLKDKLPFPNPVVFEWSRYEISGETINELPIWYKIFRFLLGGVVLLVLSKIVSIWLAIILLIPVILLLLPIERLLEGKKEHFIANLENGHWETSNERMFADSRKILDI